MMTRKTMGRRYGSVPSWTHKQTEEAVAYYGLDDWVMKARRGMQRIRIMVLCCIYYDMEPEKEYTTENVCRLLIDKDAGGPASMNLSIQRIGYFLTLMSKKGVLVNTGTLAGRNKMKTYKKVIK